MTDSDSPDVTSAIEAARQATETALKTSHAAATGTSGTELIPTGTDSAIAVKARIASQRAAVLIARNTALEAQKSARELIEAQRRELDAKLQAMNNELAPLAEQIALLSEGVWTMNLYVGRDEEIVTLAEGTPAPAGTPIHVRQQVLAMDEESGIDAETGGIDVTNIDAFDEWITADPAHLHQVLPEQRGVVVLMARRKDRDYGTPWANAAMNEANKQSWWLIRNGENLYRMQTDLYVGKRLVPARNEFTNLFIDRRTNKPLSPGTDAWMKAEKAAGARERHFMRIALVLQGLIDRTAVFAPLPKPGVSLLTPQDYDDGHVVLIADDENQLTTGRIPFYRWITALNSQLRTGMRVMITTGHNDWPERSRQRWSFNEHPRLHPPRAESPETGAVYTLTRKGKRAGEFTFSYPRTEKVWIRNEWGQEEERVPKTPASCTIRTSDPFVIPIDLVDVATMREYLGSRLERHAYVEMFPVLRAAIEFKEAEAAAEGPFRDLLAGQVAQNEDVTLDEAAALIGPVIDWWKVGNRWFRPMQGDPAAEVKAAKSILAERARIKAANDGAGDDLAIVNAILAKCKDALLVARRKDGRYVALTPTARQWAEPVDESGRRYNYRPTRADVYVTRHEFKKDGTPAGSTPWTFASPSVVSRWIVLHEGEQWATWDKTARAGDHLTDPEIEAFIASVTANPVNEHGHSLLAVSYDETTSRGGGGEFTTWWHPGPVTVPERALTDELAHVRVRTQDVRWTRNRDGSLTFTYGRLSSGGRRWDVRHNTILDATTRGDVVAPWDSDAARNYMVHIDEATVEVARKHAQDREDARVARAVFMQTVDALWGALAEQWTANARAHVKARFLEDYQDESLWEGHAKTANLVFPYGHQGTGEQRSVGGAVVWLIERAVESANPPFGLTVGELTDRRSEFEITVPAGQHGRGSSAHAFTGDIPEDLRVLRFPDAPTAIEASPSSAGIR